MKHKHLIEAIERLFGPFAKEKDILIEAAEKDMELNSKVGDSDDVQLILSSFNTIFNKKSRIISKKVIGRYRELLKYYSMEEIKKSMINAKKDEFHISTKHKYCTIEYFSRIEQIDKWINIEEEIKKEGFILPKFNVKV
jgi:hypothetical protein